MKRRLTVTMFFVLALSTSAVVLGMRRANDRQVFNKQLLAMHKQDRDSSQRQPVALPEHVTYEFFFNRIIAIQQRAIGRPDARTIRQVIRTSIEREANLNSAQLLILNNIAFTCTQQLRQQDERAGQIIAAFRSRYPQRVIPPGESLPPPPPELKALQEERNAIVLRARDQLRQAFGEQVFNRVDDVLKRRTTSGFQGAVRGTSQTELRHQQ